MNNISIRIYFFLPFCNFINNKILKLFLRIKKHQNIFNDSLTIINRYNNFSKLNQYIFLGSAENFSGEKCSKFMKIFFFFFFCDNKGTKLNWKFHVNVFTCPLWIEKIVWFSKILFEPRISTISFLLIYPSLNCFQKVRIFESSFSNNRKKSYWIFINSFLINKIQIHLSTKVFRILDGVLLDESRPRLKAKYSKNQQEVIPEGGSFESHQKFSKSQLVKFVESINRVTRVKWFINRSIEPVSRKCSNNSMNNLVKYTRRKLSKSKYNNNP